jgi:hypothetical protein
MRKKVIAGMAVFVGGFIAVAPREFDAPLWLEIICYIIGGGICVGGIMFLAGGKYWPYW